MSAFTIPRPATPHPALLTPKEVAAQLAVTAKALERWRAARIGPTFVRLTRKTIRYPADAVAAFLDGIGGIPPAGAVPA